MKKTQTMDTYEHIIEGVRREQRASQLAFYDRFHRPTYCSASAVLGAGDEAEEVMQDVLMKVLVRPALLQPDDVAMTRYLRRMATNAAIDRLRRRRPALVINEETLPDQPDESDGADEGAEALPDTDTIRHSVERLPETYRNILRLRLFGEKRFTDIAAALRANPSSVRVQYARGLSRLRKLLTRKEEG